MYKSTYELAKKAIGDIFELANSWNEFQKTNILEGAEVGGINEFDLEEVTLTANDTILEFKSEDIGDDVDRGLVNSGSSNAIKNALEDYKTTIQTKINEMINAVPVDTAFFGDQASSIKTYIDEVGTGMGEVVTAVKDLYDALDQLADSNYTNASETVTTEVDKATQSINSSLEGMGTRWQ